MGQRFCSVENGLQTQKPSPEGELLSYNSPTNFAAVHQGGRFFAAMPSSRGLQHPVLRRSAGSLFLTLPARLPTPFGRGRAAPILLPRRAWTRVQS